MTDTGRAEAVVERIQDGFIEMHISRNGVLSDKEVIGKITWVAQNHGAGYDGNVTSADDDNLNVFIMKTQDVRLQRANNTMVVISERLSQVISFAPGETLGTIEARAITSSNEIAVRIVRTIATQIIQALGSGVKYNPVYPTTNIKYKVLTSSSNELVFDGFVASYKVPSRIQGKYFGRVALIGAKNSHESEVAEKFNQLENKINDLKGTVHQHQNDDGSDAIEKKFQDIQIKLADTENRLQNIENQIEDAIEKKIQNIENRLKNTEDLIQSILDGDDPGDPEDPNDPDDPNHPVYG